MNFRHNIWGHFEVTDPFEVTNEVTEIFDFQNFSRQFDHFCSSYEKASKCYEEIEMWNSGFLRDRIDYQTVSCCVVISFPQGQKIKSRVFEPTIQQVSMSKKWDSKPALDEHGKPLLNANGKTVLRKSYSVLQDDFFAAMRKAGYDDVERGERGSSEEHLTVTQFKVQQEQARLAEFTEQNRQQEKQAATLGSKIEKIQNQRVDVRSIEKIVATSIPFSSKVAVEREDFDRISTLAKKYVTAEKKESKLQKAVDAANKLIAKLKAEIDSLKQEISDYKSVHSKLRAAELERENTELRGKVRSYEDVIQRNNLWRFFHPLREKAVTRDEAR